MAIRTIEQIKNEIRDTEQELYRLKNEFSDIEFLGVDQAAYQSIQELSDESCPPNIAYAFRSPRHVADVGYCLPR